MKKILLGSLLLVSLTSCSEFALLASGSSLAVSQNAYAKAYNGIDVLTIVKTKINWGNLDEIAKTMKEDYEVNKVDRLRKEGKL